MRFQSSALFLGYVGEFLRTPGLTGKPLTGNSGNYCTRRDLNVRRRLQVSRTDLAHLAHQASRGRDITLGLPPARPGTAQVMA